MTDSPYVGATAEQLDHHLVQQFLNIHAWFRGELATMLGYIDDLTTGKQLLSAEETTTRTHALIKAGIEYTQNLHFHHHGESDRMFPALAKEGMDADVLDRLNREHDEISELVDKFSAGINNFAAIDPAIMNNDMRRLADALRKHLAYEETHVCPLLTRWADWPPVMQAN